MTTGDGQPSGDPQGTTSGPGTDDEAAPTDRPDTPDRPVGLGQHQTRLERLREAAVQAEYATGRHEDTEEEARRGVLRRVATIVVGFVVLLGGIAMMVLPGPGILAIIAGLAILAQELAWAERLLEYVKKRAKVEELQQQPAWVRAVMWTITAGAVLGSITYFTVLR